MAKNSVIGASSLSPGRDNPRGRWDVPYLMALETLRGPEEEITASLADNIRGLSRNRTVHILDEPRTLDGTYRMLLGWLLLNDPSPPLDRGLRVLARRVMERRIEEEQARISSAQQRLAELQAGLEGGWED